MSWSFCGNKLNEMWGGRLRQRVESSDVSETDSVSTLKMGRESVCETSEHLYTLTRLPA